jgi:transcriptional regulator with XRE-family HTH domain
MMGKRDQVPEHPELAAALNAIKTQRGFTNARLARLAGVSRRHVQVALNGRNITIAILKKLMSALRIETIEIGELAAVTATAPGVNTTMLMEVAGRIESGLNEISEAASSLRAYATDPKKNRS